MEVQFSSVAQSCLTLRHCGQQHASLPCPSPIPRDCSNSCPSSRWCHPTPLPPASRGSPNEFWPSNLVSKWILTFQSDLPTLNQKRANSQQSPGSHPNVFYEQGKEFLSLILSTQTEFHPPQPGACPWCEKGLNQVGGDSPWGMYTLL